MSENLVKIVLFAVGFAVMFWALFFFGHMADKTIEEKEKAARKTEAETNQPRPTK